MNNEKTKMQGAYRFLCRGRVPFAIAQLQGTEDEGVSGEVSFYSTPAGVLVHANVSGLPTAANRRGRLTYGLCIGSGKEEQKTPEKTGKDSGKKEELQPLMPVLYEKSGHAWCSVLTGKISPAELSGISLTLRRHDGGGGCREVLVAVGEVRCAGYYRREA